MSLHVGDCSWCSQQIVCGCVSVCVEEGGKGGGCLELGL